MGLVDVSELVTFECVSCLATYTGRPHELPGQGWSRKTYKRKLGRTPGEVLFCDACTKRLEAVWETQRRLTA